MKKFILFCLSLFIINAKSQTLTQTANEPKAGDVDPEYIMDTTALIGSMPIAVTGSNCIWNYTALTTSTLLINSYVTPTAVPSASAYAGCSVVQQSGPSYTFIKSVGTPTPQTELLGLTLPLGSVNFTNSGIAARYPISYGYTLSDNVAGAFTSTITNGTCTGTLTTNADGLGTLNLPQGKSYNNVLRVKTVLRLSLVAGFIPIATVKQTVYSYYHISEKFPVLNINYTSMQITGSTSPTITTSVTGNGNILTDIAKTTLLNNNLIRMYPNPAGEILNLATEGNVEPKEIEIYNCLSQKVFDSAFSSQINLNTFESGVYFIQVNTNKGVIRSKFIKE